MSTLFFVLDVAVAMAIPLVVIALARRGTIPTSSWPLLWVGTLIGFTWELTLLFLGPRYVANPVYVLAATFPGPTAAQPMIHALWDGWFLVIGLAIAHRLVPGPGLQRFSWRQLGVLLLWAQLQSLGVEALAAWAGAWSFAQTDWNPVLVPIGAGGVSLLPQLIWLVAPLPFYAASLWVQRRVQGDRGEA